MAKKETRHEGPRGPKKPKQKRLALKVKAKKRGSTIASREILSEGVGGIGMAAPKKAKAKKRGSVIGAQEMISPGVRKSIPLGATPKIRRR